MPVNDHSVQQAILGYRHAFGKLPQEMTMHPADWLHLTGHRPTTESDTYGDLAVFFDDEFPREQIVCWGQS